MEKQKLFGDPSSRALQITSSTTGQIQEELPKDNRNPHAVALVRLGELRGGRTRAIVLTRAERIQIAKKAVQSR